MTIYSLEILLSQFGTSSMSSSNCCYLTCIRISQEAGKVVWYSHVFKNFPQFVVTHKVNGFSIVNEAEIDVFLEFSCFFYDPMDVGILISGSSAFSKSGLNTWKVFVHILLKLSLENLEHYFASKWDECNRAVVWTYFGITFLWDWNENWFFAVLRPLLFSTSAVSNSLWPYGLWPTRLLCPWYSPGQNTRVGCHDLLQRTILTQGPNLCLLCLLPWQTSSLHHLGRTSTTWEASWWLTCN